MNVWSKKMLVSICILMVSVSLGGCWDVKYLDELSIVIAFGMDAGKDQEIKVTVQIVNPSNVSTGGSKGGGGGPNSVTTYSETGRTIFEAIRKITNKTSRKLYFSHTQVLVISEDLARKGILNLFELIERDPEIRTDFYVLVAKGASASDVLKITTPIENIPGTKIHDTVENVEENFGTTYGVKIKDVIEHIRSEQTQITMGVIEIVGDVKKGGSKKNVENMSPLAVLKLNGMAAFKNEKLVGFLNSKESRGAAWTKDKVKNTVVIVPCKKGEVAIEVIHSSTTVKGKFQQGKPYVVVRVEQEANLGETLCPEKDMTDNKSIHDLERGTEEQVKKEILAAVNEAKKWRTDIFGFATAIYKEKPAYWKENKYHWESIFADIPVQVQVDTKIRREGTTNRSYFRKIY